MTPWTEACQASLSMGFLREAYWSGLPFPSIGTLPNSGIEPASPALAGGSLPLSPEGSLVLPVIIQFAVELHNGKDLGSFFNIYDFLIYFIYLASLDLSCGLRDI